MAEDHTDDGLMGRVADGDSEAFTVLYHAWSRRVMAYAYRALRDLHEAQDVAQETFLLLFRYADRYEGRGRFPAFLFRIAGNVVRGRFRKRTPVPVADREDDDAPDEGAPISEIQDSATVRMDLEKGFLHLPERQREALLLVGIEGLSYRDAAAVLQVSEEGFAQLVLRGRRNLRHAMALSEDL